MKKTKEISLVTTSTTATHGVDSIQLDDTKVD